MKEDKGVKERASASQEILLHDKFISEVDKKNVPSNCEIVQFSDGEGEEVIWQLPKISQEEMRE